jgi:hypothetical protein
MKVIVKVKVKINKIKNRATMEKSSKKKKKLILWEESQSQ